MKKIVISVTLIIAILFTFSYLHAQEAIQGADEVLIPNAGESISQYKTLEGYIFETFTLPGIQLDDNGLLTITSEATEQTLIISSTYQQKKYQKEIHLRYSWSRQNADFKKYQMKSSIEPITLPQLLTNTFFIQSVRYLILGIGAFVFIAYLMRRRKKD